MTFSSERARSLFNIAYQENLDAGHSPNTAGAMAIASLPGLMSQTLSTGEADDIMEVETEVEAANDLDLNTSLEAAETMDVVDNNIVGILPVQSTSASTTHLSPPAPSVPSVPSVPSARQEEDGIPDLVNISDSEEDHEEEDSASDQDVENNSSEEEEEEEDMNIPATPYCPRIIPNEEVLSLAKLHVWIAEATTSGSYSQLMSRVYATYSDSDALNVSFSSSIPLNNADENGHGHEKADEVSTSTTMMVSSTTATTTASCFGVDVAAATAGFHALFKVQHTGLENALRNGLESLVSQPWFIVKSWNEVAALRQFLVILSHPRLLDPESRRIVGGLCKLFYFLPKASKQLLATEWRDNTSDSYLLSLLATLQQYMSIQLYAGESVDTVFAAASLLGILAHMNETERPFVHYNEFYNDVVNSDINLMRDYQNSKLFKFQETTDRARRRARARARGLDTSALHVPKASPAELAERAFCEFPFLLDAASKATILQADASFQQHAEAHATMEQHMMHEEATSHPYLILRIRRPHIVSDALSQLAALDERDKKKPLRVKFNGEQGVDEGGVTKEFFQVILAALLDPTYGMFVTDAGTSHTLWFNSASCDAPLEFELIGQLLGIAIYNGVICNVAFPSVVYKKLLGRVPTLEDLTASNPALGQGLAALLAFDGDVEETFQRHFQLSFESSFGVITTVDLAGPTSGDTPVTASNRHEYVALYVDYMLTKSVARQFDAFQRGFLLVCGGQALELFRWEELELLICGSPDLDFAALEQVTHYDDGFTAASQTIHQFWQVVHGFSLEHKKALLRFTTGSDRVPIRGLGKMQFVISRNGPHSNRLPTAHTCFNHLLLPEYNSLAVLKERLLLAMEHTEGFGLI